MIFFMPRTLPIIGLLLLGSSLAPADEFAPPPREVRVDRYGDPLPEGAIARLGTTRFRHPGAEQLTFNADGSRFVTSGKDKKVHVWDAATGNRIHIWSQPDGTSDWRCVSADGRLAAIQTRKDLEVWNIQDQKLLRKLPLRDSPSFSAAVFSADGRLIATADHTPREHRLRVWDLATGADRLIGASEGRIEQLLLSPDSRTLYSNSDDEGCCRAWDLSKEREIWHYEGRVAFIGLSRNGERLVGQRTTVTGDIRIVVFDAATGNYVDLPPGYDGGHPALSPDGKQVAIMRFDRFDIVDIKTGKSLFQIWRHSEAIAFRPDGKALYVIGQGSVQAYVLGENKPLFPEPIKKGPVSPIVGELIWSPNSDRLVSNHRDSSLLWDTMLGEILARVCQ